jgi:hypothetical protein
MFINHINIYNYLYRVQIYIKKLNMSIILNNSDITIDYRASNFNMDIVKSDIYIKDTNLENNILNEPQIIPEKYNIEQYIHLNSGNFTEYTKSFTQNTLCDILIVGGGGGGDRENGGGGGGGAVLYATNVVIPSGTYIIKVGAGGSQNTKGYSSEAFGAICLGGGSTSFVQWGETGQANNGTSGGSGSGGSAGNGSNGTGGEVGISTKGVLLSNGKLYNGNIGGNGLAQATSGSFFPVCSGGGGGAGSAGLHSKQVDYNTRATWIAAGKPGSGGDGVAIDILGTTYYWGAGGGGGSFHTHAGDGGLGGGGGGGAFSRPSGLTGAGGINSGNNSLNTSSVNGGNGVQNTGSGGGGGGGGSATNGGAGGSGIVIIKYRDYPTLEGNPVSNKLIKFSYIPPPLVYDFTPYNTEATWKAYATSIGATTYFNYFDSSGLWRVPENGYIQLTLPSGYNMLKVNYNNPHVAGTIVNIYIDNVLKDTCQAGLSREYIQSYTTDQILRIEEVGAIIGKNLKITLMNTNYIYNFNPTKSVEYQAQLKTGVGGWRIVRYLPPNIGRYYQGDHINGSTISVPLIGTPYNYTNEWAVPFGNFDEMFFATFDTTHWLYCFKSAVLGNYSNVARPIIKSSTSSIPYSVNWYNRITNTGGNAGEDPWISITPSIQIYAESSTPGNTTIKDNFGGLCVLVRDSVINSNITKNIEYQIQNKTGVGGWRIVRFLPSTSTTWYPIDDNLTGTTSSGISYDYTNFWTIPFGTFDEFVFATFNTNYWLQVTKFQAIGTNYDNSPRTIIKSSISNTSYTANWYNRSTAPEDPWIGLRTHQTAPVNNPEGGGDLILYGENSYASGHWSLPAIAKDGGLCVLVRDSTLNSLIVDPTSSLIVDPNKYSIVLKKPTFLSINNGAMTQFSKGVYNLLLGPSKSSFISIEGQIITTSTSYNTSNIDLRIRQDGNYDPTYVTSDPMAKINLTSEPIVSYYDNYVVETFTYYGTGNTGDYTISFAQDTLCDILIVGGGGGGSAGGGGAGGYVYNTSVILNGSYTINVGKGGAGATGTTSGSQGTNSSLIGGSISYIAFGGGGGGGNPVTGNEIAPAHTTGQVGSYGGNGHNQTTIQSYTSTQGNRGGRSILSSGGSGGGGGGAGAIGGDATFVPGLFAKTDNTIIYNKGGQGGDGIANSITGTSIYYAGGGTAGANTNQDSDTSAQIPVLGGGGLGARANNANGTNGTNGLGGGGGGGDFERTAGTTGGSGIVIIRYLDKCVRNYYSHEYIYPPYRYFTYNSTTGTYSVQNGVMDKKDTTSFTYNYTYDDIANTIGNNNNTTSLVKNTHGMGEYSFSVGGTQRDGGRSSGVFVYALQSDYETAYSGTRPGVNSDHNSGTLGQGWYAGTGWLGNAQTYNSSFYYNSLMPGAWVKILMPKEIIFTSFEILGGKQHIRAPKNFKIYGSNLNTTNFSDWTLLHTQVNYTYVSFGGAMDATTAHKKGPKVKIVNNVPFKNYLLVISEKYSEGVNDIMVFQGWYIYGREKIAYSPAVYSFNHSGGSELNTSHNITFSHPTLCDILVVGGGGGGGKRHGGGGGAGTLLYHKNVILDGTYNIMVGKGGTGHPSASTTQLLTAFDGNYSQLVKSDGTQNYYASGGGRGTSSGWTHANTNGGQGFITGGSARTNYTYSNELTLPLNNIFNDIPVQVLNKEFVNILISPEGCRGNMGGTQVQDSKGGGGGGAKTRGDNHDAADTNPDTMDGYGGLGLDIDITGTLITYAGGGGGSDFNGTQSQVFNPAYPTIQSRGGGGFGSDNGTAQNGLDGTGGGGGGQGNDTAGNPGGNGGSGIVIIRAYNYKRFGFNTILNYLALPIDSVHLIAWYRLDGNGIDSSGVTGNLINRNRGLTYDYKYDISTNLPYASWANSSSTANDYWAITPDINRNVPLTFAFWFRVEDTGSYTMMGYGNNSGNDPGIQFDINAGSLNINTALDVSWTFTATYAGIKVNTWYHLCYVLTDENPVKTYLYVNAVLVATNTGTLNKLLKRVNNLTIANGGDNVKGYRGDLGDIRIYNVALSFVDIITLYNGYKPNTYNINFPTNTIVEINNSGYYSTFKGSYDINISSTGFSIIPVENQIIPKLNTFNSKNLDFRFHLLNPTRDPTGAQWTYNNTNTNVYYLGNVGIGTKNPEYSLHVNGNIFTTEGAYITSSQTSWTTLSDRRIKTNIAKASYEKCLENVKNIELYRFNFKNDIVNTNDRNQLGFIAQEVQNIYPKAVEANQINNSEIEGLLTLDTTQIDYSLYGAVKYLIEKVEYYEKKLANYESNLITSQEVVTDDTPDTPNTPDTPDTPDTSEFNTSNIEIITSQKVVTDDTPDTPNTSEFNTSNIEIITSQEVVTDDTPNTPDTPDTSEFNTSNIEIITSQEVVTDDTPDTPNTSEFNTSNIEIITSQEVVTNDTPDTPDTSEFNTSNIEIITSQEVVTDDTSDNL